MTTPSAHLATRSVDLDRLAAVCRRLGVIELAIFGSSARGEATGTSDFDLLYVLGPGVSLGFSINELEDALTVVFGGPVDLVSKCALHPMLREQVLGDAQVVYAA